VYVCVSVFVVVRTPSARTYLQHIFTREFVTGLGWLPWLQLWLNFCLLRVAPQFPLWQACVIETVACALMLAVYLPRVNASKWITADRAVQHALCSVGLALSSVVIGSTGVVYVGFFGLQMLTVSYARFSTGVRSGRSTSYR
jgi:hypothetical protein